VVCFSDDLDEWTAAQITDLNSSWKTAGVLELDWSGPEPTSVKDLGRVSPLALTHHAWIDKTSHTNYEWVLPRSYKVIGSLPLVRKAHSDSYSTGWNLGMQLAAQRRWDHGDHESSGSPGDMKLKGSEFDAFLGEHRRRDIWALMIEDAKELDCAHLVEALPGLRRLILRGTVGRLENADQLNRLSHLKALAISSLFGMTKSDVLLPARVPNLEWLALHDVPREYGAAVRSAWAPELAKGCYTGVSGLRTPEWLVENLDNPLRDWDGREHIGAAKFRKSVAQYKTTRLEILAAIADAASADLKARLLELGREFGQAFNKLAKGDDFIETEEREELFAALTAIPNASGSLSGEAANEAGDWLAQGLDETRNW
jgi:hypothetical protein